MRKLIRAGVLVATGVLTLVFAGSAFSAINPRLSVGTSTQAGNTKTSIQAQMGTTDDALGRLQVFVPAGFKLDSPPGGVDVGTVSATALSTQIGPEIPFTMSGKLTAIPVNDPAVAYEAANCDPGTHLGAWMARLTGGGNTWNFVVFVDATTGTEAQFGQYRLVACFKALAGANVDPYGNKFVSMSLGLTRLGAPTAPGTYKWRSLWTPFAANSASLNTAGSVEAQSNVRIGSGALTLSGKRSGKVQVRVTLNGKLIAEGETLGDAIVALRHGATRSKLVALANVRTTGNGSFSKVINLKKTQYFQAGTTLGGQDLGAAGCTASFGSAVPCVSATNGKVALVSRLIHFPR